MSGCVVDASIFGPLFFEDETDVLFGGLPALLADGACVAPQNWRIELTNQILVGSRRKRIALASAKIAVAQLAELEVKVDQETWQRHGEIFDLAVKHGLTAYDAAYLELAIRRKTQLASYDADLRDAARHEGLDVYPE